MTSPMSSRIASGASTAQAISPPVWHEIAGAEQVIHEKAQRMCLLRSEEFQETIG
jgi:hypothetical protein